jgi:hypothetical protein
MLASLSSRGHIGKMAEESVVPRVGLRARANELLFEWLMSGLVTLQVLWELERFVASDTGESRSCMRFLVYT